MALPLPDWHASLDEMDATLAATVAALDAFEATWTRVLEEVPSVSNEDRYSRLEMRLSEWDMRLAAAAELAESVESELTERETVVSRWRELFEGWRSSLEQSMKPAGLTS